MGMRNYSGTSTQRGEQGNHGRASAGNVRLSKRPCKIACNRISSHNPMNPRIAIPVPHSTKDQYNRHSLPLYKLAIERCGAEAVEVPLEATPEEVAKIATSCQGVLLPGSPADVDPQKFGELRKAETNDADPKRDNADELLLQDAYNMRKPVLGIGYGLQTWNVWRTAAVLQHISS